MQRPPARTTRVTSSTTAARRAVGTWGNALRATTTSNEPCSNGRDAIGDAKLSTSAPSCSIAAAAARRRSGDSSSRHARPVSPTFEASAAASAVSEHPSISRRSPSLSPDIETVNGSPVALRNQRIGDYGRDQIPSSKFQIPINSQSPNPSNSQSPTPNNSQSPTPDTTGQA